MSVSAMGHAHALGIKIGKAPCQSSPNGPGPSSPMADFARLWAGRGAVIATVKQEQECVTVWGRRGDGEGPPGELVSSLLTLPMFPVAGPRAPLPRRS